jgi:hypothetical protein
MKKHKIKTQSHRLSLNRETIRFLDDLAFFELVRGGMSLFGCPSTTSHNFDNCGATDLCT